MLLVLKDVSKHPMMHRTVPAIKNDPAPAGNHEVAKKAWYKQKTITFTHEL
jgi:hypothetical protein